MKTAFALAAVMAVLLPGLAMATDRPQHIKYSCADNEILDVVYIGDYAVMLQMDELVPMKLARTASGVRYLPISKDYTYELWGKGDDMNLSGHDGGKEQTILTDCHP